MRLQDIAKRHRCNRLILGYRCALDWNHSGDCELTYADREILMEKSVRIFHEFDAEMHKVGEVVSRSSIAPGSALRGSSG